MSPAVEAPPDAECVHCGHSPAYHDGDGGHPCRAWNPDNPDFFCSCLGWKPKPPTAPPEEPAWEPSPFSGSDPENQYTDGMAHAIIPAVKETCQWKPNTF